MALGNSWTTVASGSQSKQYYDDYYKTYFTLTLSYYIDAKLDSQSTTNNQSYISIRARTTVSHSLSSYNVSFTATGCRGWTPDSPYSFGNTTVLTGSATVNHNAAGAGSLSVSGRLIAGGMGYDISISGSIALPTIDRYSVLTAFNNFIIEDGFSIGFTDYLNNKTLTLTCKINNDVILEKTYTSTSGAHTDSFTFTNEQLSIIYNSVGASQKSAKFSLTLATSGISPTSSKEATGTLKSNLNAPIIDSESISEADSKLIECGVADNEIVRYLSSKLITATASARNGATISGIKVRNGSSGTDYDMTKSNGSYSKALSNLTANTFILTATDSRGFTATATITCTIKNYTRPSVEKIDFDRTSAITSTGYVRPVGSYWFGSAGNTTNSVTWKYRISSTSSAQEATCVGSKWSGEATLPSGTLLRENTYECTVIVTDAFGESASLSTSIGPAKLSAWIGKETMRAEGFVGAHYIGVFPVGSIYMSVTDTNPGEYFGGTWVQIGQGRTLVGVGPIGANTTSDHGDVAAGSFSPAVNEMGGALSHRHYMHGIDADGPRAAIGAVDQSPNRIGYYAVTPSAFGVSSTGSYVVQGTNVTSESSSHTFNHYTPVYGYTQGTGSIEPYLAVYIWQRTA